MIKNKKAHTIYPLEIQIEDEIGNVYQEAIPEDFRNEFLKQIRSGNQ
jgi:hypothetical protein